MLLLGIVVVLGTLLPFSVLHRAPSCPDTLNEAGEDSAQLAFLAQLAQQNEQLLRDLANSENVSGLTHLVPPVRKEEAPPDQLVVAAAVQAGTAQSARITPIPYSAPGIWLRMAIMSVGRKDNSEYLLRTLVSQHRQSASVLVLQPTAPDILGLTLQAPDRATHSGRAAEPLRAQWEAAVQP